MSFFARLFRNAPAPTGPLARGTEALRAGRFDEADAHFTELIAIAPDEKSLAIAHNKRALVAVARGDGAAADAHIATALNVYPACVPAMVNSGNRLLEAGDVLAAIERLEAAVALDPDFPEAHHNLGVAYRRAGRRGDAVREFRRATGLERRRKNGAES